MHKSLFALCLSMLMFWSCQSDALLPKPKAQLSLTYPKVSYKSFKTDCPFTFEVSTLASVKVTEKCWITITYPLLNASIDVTYKPVKNNLKALLQDAEKLTYRHAIKADAITSQPYIDLGKHIYATEYHVTGNAASQIQFHATDSLSHFITGALYFNREPNYDSIYPAVKFIGADVRHLIESLNWK